MRPKSRLVFVGHLLVLLLLIPILTGIALAQSPPVLTDLNIALWPEYDRPEVLVIFRGRIADDEPLPAELSFTLPSTVVALNAVAYLDEAQGRLLNIPEYEFVEASDGKVLGFASPGREFQFEYYSGDILNVENGVRDLIFSFTPDTDVANLTFELQQPTKSQAFTSEPPSSDTQVRADGLEYALYDLGAVSAGDSRSLQASYTRSSDQLSADALASVSIPSSPDQTQVVGSGDGLKNTLGPILIVAGILFLTASLVYWFWSQRAVVVPQPATGRKPAQPRRRPRKRQPKASRSTPSPEQNESLATYCQRCGTKFRKDAMFCHACGAERRAD